MSRIFSVNTLRNFVKLEATGGIVLFVAAFLAVICQNSSLSHLYELFLSTKFSVQLGSLSLSKPLLLWINDGLMALFFLLVGLELKREFLIGELSEPSKAVLPLIAAIGGMIVPALIYVALNFNNSEYLHGWAIPTATDIAFALGVLSLFGKRVSYRLKLFLTALAIFDDLGAIAIIALVYTDQLSFTALMLSIAALIILLLINRARISALTPYCLVGAFLWVCVLKSGVHATLAGVALAMAIPLRIKDRQPLKDLEHTLHPWVAFVILPLFAFANAGVDLRGLDPSILMERVPMGITLGLVLGKPLGICLLSLAAIKLGIAKMPEGGSVRTLLGVGCLGGVGFTMSLFIGSLAFSEPADIVMLRLGVICGSLLSVLIASMILLGVPKEKAG